MCGTKRALKCKYMVERAQAEGKQQHPHGDSETFGTDEDERVERKLKSIVIIVKLLEGSTLGKVFES